MADIIKAYTAEQLYNMGRNVILASGCGITDFNDGSRTKAIIQAVADIVSTVSMDMKTSIYKAIPIALYEGLKFKRKAATYATGGLRPYRMPLFVLRYTGASTAVTITTTTNGIRAACIGAPADAFAFDYASHKTVTDLAAAINALPNWSADVVSGSTASANIFCYNNVTITGAKDYKNTAGFNVMSVNAGNITIPKGFTCSIDDITIATTQSGTIKAGESGTVLKAQCYNTGILGNINVNAIDTATGKGAISSTIPGIEYCINDSAFTGGSDQESDAARSARFIKAINSLNAGTVQGIESAVEAIDGVKDVGILPNHPNYGNVTILVSGLTDEITREINKILNGDTNDKENYPGKGVAGINYIITEPNTYPINVDIKVTKSALSDITNDDLAAGIKTVIETYINNLSIGEPVIVSTIINTARNYNLAVYDVQVVTPTENITVEKTSFARTGAGYSSEVTVTIQAQNG